MFNFKSWALETQASMERKFQMSRILPLSSEVNLLLVAPWNLKPPGSAGDLAGCSLSLSSTSLTLFPESFPSAYTRGISPILKTCYGLYHFSSNCPFSLFLFREILLEKTVCT